MLGKQKTKLQKNERGRSFLRSLQVYKSAEFDASLLTKERIEGMCSITSGLIISNCMDRMILKTRIEAEMKQFPIKTYRKNYEFDEKGNSMSKLDKTVASLTTYHAGGAAVLGVQLPNQRRKEEDVENAREHNPKDKRQHFGIGNTCVKAAKLREDLKTCNE
jgi:hypothetical protein